MSRSGRAWDLLARVRAVVGRWSPRRLSITLGVAVFLVMVVRLLVPSPIGLADHGEGQRFLCQLDLHADIEPSRAPDDFVVLRWLDHSFYGEACGAAEAGGTIHTSQRTLLLGARALSPLFGTTAGVDLRALAVVVAAAVGTAPQHSWRDRLRRRHLGSLLAVAVLGLGLWSLAAQPTAYRAYEEEIGWSDVVRSYVQHPQRLADLGRRGMDAAATHRDLELASYPLGAAVGPARSESRVWTTSFLFSAANAAPALLVVVHTAALVAAFRVARRRRSAGPVAIALVAFGLGLVALTVFWMVLLAVGQVHVVRHLLVFDVLLVWSGLMALAAVVVDRRAAQGAPTETPLPRLALAPGRAESPPRPAVSSIAPPVVRVPTADPPGDAAPFDEDLLEGFLAGAAAANANDPLCWTWLYDAETSPDVEPDPAPAPVPVPVPVSVSDPSPAAIAVSDLLWASPPEPDPEPEPELEPDPESEPESESAPARNPAPPADSSGADLDVLLDASDLDFLDALRTRSDADSPHPNLAP